MSSIGQILSARYQNDNDDLKMHKLSRFWLRADGPVRVLAPVIYIAGMVTFSISLIPRVLYLVKEIIFLVGALITAPCSGLNPLRTRFVVLLFTGAEVGAALVGIVCPPLACKIDRWIQSYEVVIEKSGFFNYNPWASYRRPPGAYETKIAQYVPDDALLPITRVIDIHFETAFNTFESLSEEDLNLMREAQQSIVSIPEFSEPVYSADEYYPETPSVLLPVSLIRWIDEYCVLYNNRNRTKPSFLNLFFYADQIAVKVKFLEAVCQWRRFMESNRSKKEGLIDYLIYKISYPELLPPPESITDEDRKDSAALKNKQGKITTYNENLKICNDRMRAEIEGVSEEDIQKLDEFALQMREFRLMIYSTADARKAVETLIFSKVIKK